MKERKNLIGSSQKSNNRKTYTPISAYSIATINKLFQDVCLWNGHETVVDVLQRDCLWEEYYEWIEEDAQLGGEHP